jgi:pimeloyl-ACP methyl ester carboxylesterase
MFRIHIILLLLISLPGPVAAQQVVKSFPFGTDIKITIDAPGTLHNMHPLWIIWYALPNGSTTEQTMGKKMQPGDDWHYGIQHIAAQTAFLRYTVKNTDIVVIYAENIFRSWPAWKNQHTDYVEQIQRLMDSVNSLFHHTKKQIQLNGHSGGGRFIFSYLEGVPEIPAEIKRISFLDSNYGYDSTYLPKFTRWLKANRDSHLAVFAYNDSVALYEGKPFVSATGGTWYRSRLMLRDLSLFFSFKENSTDSMLRYSTTDKRLQFFLKTNPSRKIFHTVQVERNGFIHAVLNGTPYDSRNYRYYGERAYERFIR